MSHFLLVNIRSLRITKTEMEQEMVYENSEEAEVENFGSGSSCQILPGLQKLRRICNIALVTITAGDTQDREKTEKNGEAYEEMMNLKGPGETNITVDNAVSDASILEEGMSREDDWNVKEVEEDNGEKKRVAGHNNKLRIEIVNSDGNIAVMVGQNEIKVVMVEKGNKRGIENKDAVEEEGTDFGCNDEESREEMREDIGVKKEAEAEVEAEAETETEVEQASGHLTISTNGSLQFVVPLLPRKIFGVSGSVLRDVRPTCNLLATSPSIIQDPVDIPGFIPRKESSSKGWVVPSKKVIAPSISQLLPLGNRNLGSSTMVTDISSNNDGSLKTGNNLFQNNISSNSTCDEITNGESNFMNVNSRLRTGSSTSTSTGTNMNELIPQRVINVVKLLHLPRNSSNNIYKCNGNSDSNNNSNNKYDSTSTQPSSVVETAKSLLEKSTKFQVK